MKILDAVYLTILSLIIAFGVNSYCTFEDDGKIEQTIERNIKCSDNKSVHLILNYTLTLNENAEDINSKLSKQFCKAVLNSHIDGLTLSVPSNDYAYRLKKRLMNLSLEKQGYRFAYFNFKITKNEG